MRWTVGRRIAAGFALGLGLTLVVTLAGMVALGRTTKAYQIALDGERNTLTPALVAESEARESNLEFLRFILSREDQFARSRDSTLALARGYLTVLRDSAATPELRAVWSESLVLLAQWDTAARASMAAAAGGRQAQALSLWETRALPARRAARAGINRGVARAREYTDRVMLDARTAARRMELALLIVALLSLVVGTLAAVLLNRAVSHPLQDTSSVLASSAAEILAATTQQATGATESSAAVAETLTTVEEVTQTAEQATQRAKTVATTAQRASEIGMVGRKAVDDSIAAMTQIKEQVEGIAESILTLAEQAQAIGEIIDSVNDVAEQTNLLALNAAVEAARAGEQGRGFAVVAGEVKTLAAQSKKATVQVRQLLGEIQRATSAAVVATERGTKEVAAGSKQVSDAGATIRALGEAIAEASQAAAQIVASAGQQAAGMSQIRQAMTNIHEVTQQNLASTKQTETAIRDLSTLGGRLLTLVGGSRSRRRPATPA